MSSFYHHIENNAGLNKIVDAPYPSGAGAIPYTFGWLNKYSPKPLGLRVRPDRYSILANSSITINQQVLSHATLSFQEKMKQFAGPINTIYEVELSGVSALSDGCIDCDSLNRKYLVYSPRLNFTGNIFFNPSSNIANILELDSSQYPVWLSYTCDNSRIVNLCDYDRIQLELKGTNIIEANVNTSGNIDLIVTLSQKTANSRVLFTKSFGNIGYYNSGTAFRKPYMMDGEYLLPFSGVVVGLNTTQNSSFVSPGVGREDFNGASSSGDFNCSFTNASCTIRPYKSALYDVKNTNMVFHSGQNHPIDIFNYTATFCNNYYLNHGINYTGLIAAPTNYRVNNNNYRFFPDSFALNFNGVQNSGGLVNCVPCSDFYSKTKYLTHVGVVLPGAGDTVGNEQQFYIASKYRIIAKEEKATNYDYYNICDGGCNSLIVADLVRPLNFEKGPCNNFIDFIVYGSALQAGAFNGQYSLTAYLFFGSTYVSGSSVSPDTRYSSKTLYKPICQYGGTIPCNSNFGVSGLIDCFTPSIWSSGWTLIDTPNITTGGISQYGRPIIAPYLDINNYCDFTNAQPIITPTQSPSIQCAAEQCTICNDGTHVPRTVTIRAYTYGAFGVPAYDQTFIVGKEQLGNFAISENYTFGGKGDCSWKRRVTGALPAAGGLPDSEHVFLQYATVSSGYTMFKLGGYFNINNGTTSGTWYSSTSFLGGFGIGQYSGLIGKTLGHCSGINSRGKVLDYTVDCNTTMYASGDWNFVDYSGRWVYTAGFMEATFGDLYDIRDYI